MTHAWLQVQGGKRFDLGAPKPEMVDFDVMAHVLARIPRFVAHTEGVEIYSVAQHCVEGAAAIYRDTGRKDWAAAFLLHDGHEYVMGDIAIPVRDALCYHAVGNAGDLGADLLVREAFRALKASLDEAIYTAAGMAWPLPEEARRIVRLYDTRMLRTERDVRLAKPPESWAPEYEGAEPVEGVDLSEWGPIKARIEFEDAIERLLPILRISPGARAGR